MSLKRIIIFLLYFGFHNVFFLKNIFKINSLQQEIRKKQEKLEQLNVTFDFKRFFQYVYLKSIPESKKD